MNNPYSSFGVSDATYKVASELKESISGAYQRVDDICSRNQLKVLRAFQNARLSEVHFGFPTGYGYDDVGREKLEQIYAEVFGGESSYVRVQISSGTQAIAACLYGVLRPGDDMICATGLPYDTLCTVIGLKADDAKSNGSLREFDIGFSQVELKTDGSVDIEGVLHAITPKTKLVLIQKSKGYSTRPCLNSALMADAIRSVKTLHPDVVVLVDNCYGEFVEDQEPCELGADLCAGSLIKNPGGGICPSGGYIVGRADLVEKVASHVTAPGLGSHIGPSLGFNRIIAQGLYLAPHIVSESMKGAIFASALFEKFGFSCAPASTDLRGDIVQSVQFENAEQVIAFCKIVQASSPVDAFVTPEPWPMPGYDSDVIMAAGTFTQGSSIELSADGPIKSPYMVYMQGGLVSEQVKLAAMLAVERMGGRIA